MTVFLATIALMLISGMSGATFGYLGALLAIGDSPFVQHAVRRGDTVRGLVVPSDQSRTHAMSVLTDSEGDDPGMVAALTEQPASDRPLPSLTLLTPARSTPIDWMCRWCKVWASHTTRPRTLVQDEHAAHMRICPLRPEPPQGPRHRFVNGPPVQPVSSGSYS